MRTLRSTLVSLIVAGLVGGAAAPARAQVPTSTVGTKSADNAVPGADNLAVMPAVVCSSARALTLGKVNFPCMWATGPLWVTIHKSDGSEITYITTVTQAATLAKGGVMAPNASFLYGDDGTTVSLIRTRPGLIGSTDIGLVVRPFLPSDGTNTTPAGDAAARAIYVNEGASTPILANALSTSVTTVVGSAARLMSYYCSNPNTSKEYVQFFDISGAVTLGTSVPKWSIAVPPNDGAANLTRIDLNFANAIKVAATTTATGSSAPATALDCNFGYR